MTVKVVDASALACILFDEPGADGVVVELDGVKLTAPSLMPFELASICWKKSRRHHHLRADLLARFATYPDFGVDLRPVDHLDALELALATGLTAYDASYLWLARHLDAELVTLDQQLQRATLAKHP